VKPADIIRFVGLSLVSMLPRCLAAPRMPVAASIRPYAKNCKSDGWVPVDQIAGRTGAEIRD